jgi:CheY-like chemotaxis protein
VLGRVGMTVKYAENGLEGLEVLQQSPDVSLVLMDIMMPEMDGYETIRTIRRTPRLAHLPIIALTAKAMPGDREKAIDSGASEYIPKPVNVDRLLSVVCDLLDPPDDSGAAVPDSAVPQQGDGTEDHDHDPPEREP